MYVKISRSSPNSCRGEPCPRESKNGKNVEFYFFFFSVSKRTHRDSSSARLNNALRSYTRTRRVSARIGKRVVDEAKRATAPGARATRTVLRERRLSRGVTMRVLCLCGGRITLRARENAVFERRKADENAEPPLEKNVVVRAIRTRRKRTREEVRGIRRYVVRTERRIVSRATNKRRAIVVSPRGARTKSSARHPVDRVLAGWNVCLSASPETAPDTDRFVSQ